MTLEEFFDGNTDEESIGGGHLEPDCPGLRGCRDVLLNIRQAKQTQGVFLEVCEVPDGEDEDDLWVSVIRAMIFTDAPLTDVERWLEPLCPRDVWEQPEAVVEGDLLRFGDDVRASGIRLPHPVEQLRPSVRVVWVDLR